MRDTIILTIVMAFIAIIAINGSERTISARFIFFGKYLNSSSSVSSTCEEWFRTLGIPPNSTLVSIHSSMTTQVKDLTWTFTEGPLDMPVVTVTEFDMISPDNIVSCGMYEISQSRSGRNITEVVEFRAAGTAIIEHRGFRMQLDLRSQRYGDGTGYMTIYLPIEDEGVREAETMLIF